MSTREGITGTGALYYPPDPELLKGVLASEGPKFYPDNYCFQCAREGVFEAEHCGHKHWRIREAE